MALAPRLRRAAHANLIPAEARRAVGDSLTAVGTKCHGGLIGRDRIGALRERSPVHDHPHVPFDRLCGRVWSPTTRVGMARAAQEAVGRKAAFEAVARRAPGKAPDAAM